MLMHHPSHSGPILREYLEGHSVTQVAAHHGVSRTALTRVLTGKAGVSAEMSLKLGEALGTSPDFWFNMQNQYDFWHAAQARRKRIMPLPTAA